ncbi:MAG TPA: DUF6677 family protein, partial [Candidatus Acidoferrales bacterium]|nr:DUF6677 family protein [Candidatus Acidoferrales bacterium]
MNDFPVNEAPAAPDGIHESESPVAAVNPAARSVSALSIAIAAWLVPGLGHFLMGRRGRAIAFFIAVGGLAL